MSAAPLHPHGAELAAWARARVREELGGAPAVCPTGAWCDAPGATFVTLRWPDGRLQGCIGSLVPRRAIVADVAENAIAAAIRDRRSLPLQLADVDAVDLELPILSKTEPIAFTTQDEALAALKPGADGVVFRWRGHDATFLPVMWGELPEARVFLGELKRKAGLPFDFWANGVT